VLVVALGTAGKVTDPLRSPLVSSEQADAEVKINIRGPGRTLQVFAFGQFCMQFETGSQTHSVVGNHQIRMLLKCLVAAPGYRLSREQLCERLWPEHDAVQARDALRQALSRLRRILEPHREGW
jgi:DNA-binding response OmpR family regulator